MNYKGIIIIPILKVHITSSAFLVMHIGKEDISKYVIKTTSISSNSTLDSYAYLSSVEEILKSIHQQRIDIKNYTNPNNILVLKQNILQM